ncbi:MAG: nucleoside kinase [Kiritimatiellae bacterium]|nr:nucleoside kinase [Kiritimatiellia bacterium]
MNTTIHVTLEGGRIIPCAPQTRVGELLSNPVDPSSGLPYLGALVNNDLVTFDDVLDIDSTIRFVTLRDPAGMKIYRRSLSFLLAKAVKDLHPSASFSIEHAMGPSLYCEFAENGVRAISAEAIKALERHLRALVEADLPIVRNRLSYGAAVKRFADAGQEDKVALLRHRNTPKIEVFDCDGYTDLATGPFAPSTGTLRFFRLIPFQDGFALHLPTSESAPELPPFAPDSLIADIFREYNRWGRILGADTVGHLNDIVAAGKASDFIRVAEALHEKKIAAIADRVAAIPDVKWILIAGPSSSGKTTFAKRLAIHLRVNGLRPVTLSTDDYFVDREHTPRTASGDYDFEHIRAVDIETLNADLAALDAGREIRVPTFDFLTGKRLYKGKTMRLAPDEVVILEGIHSLNPELTPALPAARKFHIYISALTQLNLDYTNRISTTDNRLIRRLVRDHRFRGHSAERTLTMWPNVGRGERTWIFPFQNQADAVFNSALDYELAVLAPEAKVLLSQIKPDQPIYAEARRMRAFLSHFLPLPRALPPPTSILREFIGDSAFDY